MPRLPNLDRLTRSPDSRTVFTALARLCVPTFSDTCTITITEAGKDVHHIRQPRSDTDTTPPLRRAGLVSGWLSSHTVRTWIEVRPSARFPGCQGFATFGWGDYRPDLVDITDANYLTSRAVQVINRQRRGTAPVS